MKYQVVTHTCTGSYEVPSSHAHMHRVVTCTKYQVVTHTCTGSYEVPSKKYKVPSIQMGHAQIKN